MNVAFPYILSDVIGNSQIFVIRKWLVHHFYQKFSKSQSSYTNQIRNITNTFIIPYGKNVHLLFYFTMIFLLKNISSRTIIKKIFTLFYYYEDVYIYLISVIF
jgi:hypothetical protein